MTDTLQTPTVPPEPPSRRTPTSTPVIIVVVLAVLVLGVVAIVAMTRGGSSTMMGTNGMPGSMMGGSMMSDGSMMGGSMMGHGSSSPTIPGAREIAVTAGAFKLEPAEIHVKAGEDVTIVLTATDLAHDFTIDELGFHVVASPGQPGRGSFRAPSASGRYTAYCSVAGHRQAGMTATVIVDPA